MPNIDQSKEPAPLVVKPRAAWRMLACSNTRGYELLAARELESFLDGRSRKITVESIRQYISRKLNSTASNIVLPAKAERGRRAKASHPSR